MSLKKPEAMAGFSHPVIVHWDIGSLSRQRKDIIKNICNELIQNRIFILELRDATLRLSDESRGILNNLKGSGIHIHLTINHSALETLTSEEFMPVLRKVFVHAGSDRDVAAIIDDLRLIEKKPVPFGISFTPDETIFKHIPRILRLCLKEGITDVNFPIQRPREKQNVFFIDPAKSSCISSEIEDIPISKLNLTVHDPFLWRTLDTGTNENREGCQGANTMAYISENLDVTPCPLLPVSLGNLHSARLQEIFISDKSRRIRAILSIPPAECKDCNELKTCKGGCRGRSYILHRNFDRKDPACPL